VLRGVAEITLSHLRKEDGYNEPALFQRIRGQLREEELSENSKDDLKILLRIQSIHNYFPHPHSKLGTICLDINMHQPSTHCGG